MEELKKIPEQRVLYDSWGISKEFCELIDRLPYYSGVVLEDGKFVNLSFISSAGFDPVIPLEVYIKGAIYAILKEKYASTYVPTGLESKVKEQMNKIVNEEFITFDPVTYTCSSRKQLKKLNDGDSCK